MADPIELVARGARRRRWPVEEKLRLVSEATAPGARVAEVARRYDVSPNLLYTWRRMAEGRVARPMAGAQLVPVTLAAAPAAPARGGWTAAGRIEIGLPGGISVAIDESVTPGRLAEVLAILRR